MNTTTVTDSVLAIMLSVGFLAVAVMAIACCRPPGQRGGAMDSCLLLAGLALTGTSGGFGVAFMARAGFAPLGSYGPAFLACILSGLVFAAIYALKGRGRDTPD